MKLFDRLAQSEMVRIAKRLHRDDRGAEGLEKLLIIAAIVIPLLGVLLIFRRAIQDWVTSSWEDMTGQADITDPNPTVP